MNAVMNDRDRALQILERIEKENIFAAPLLESRGDDRDRRFVRTLVLGVLRWRSRLDYVIESLSGRRVAMLDRLTRQILRLGVYQLMYSDVPPHAAVHETVSLAARRSARSKGLVNAVLRKASAAALHEIVPAGDSIAASAVRYAHPEWLLARWAQTLGAARAIEVAKANQELSYSDLMINPRLDLDAAYAMLRERGVGFEPSPLLDRFVRLSDSAAPLASEIERGDFYAMDEGSAVVAAVVDATAKSVLDFTAAPGGKSLFLSLRGQQVVSQDISISRLRPLARSARAMSGERPRSVVADGRKPPFARRFDSVLLDAPCSATGTIRRNPELKWRLTSESIASFAETQEALLDAALDRAANECVYATCSLEAEENEGVVAAVLSRRSDFALASWGDEVPSKLRPSTNGAALRLTPDGGTDGFTIHKLRRTVSES